MAITGHLHKIVWGGKLATTETWSCGVHFLNDNPGVMSETLFASALGQWMVRATSKVSANAYLEWMKINEIDPLTGKYVDQGNPRTYFFGAPANGAGGYGFPHLSIAVSTKTALLRGHASKGRFYPPLGNIALTVVADGRTDITTATGMSTSASQLLTDFNGASTGSCVVFSKIGQLAQEITGTRVGRVADVQSRRRKNLVEDYQATLIS